MKRRILLGMMILMLGCGAGAVGSGSGGHTGTASGGAQGSGTGGDRGTGGGTGGKGTGGASTGTGGATTGTGGKGTGGAATGGAAPGGRAGGTATGDTAGHGGTGGTAAGSGGGPGGASGVVSTGSVLERNNHPSRDGLFLQPQITRTSAAAAPKTMDAAFMANFTGAVGSVMYASPLYVENGPGGKGAFIAVTTSNDVLALDETTGAVLWKTNLGVAPGASGAGCGNIKPLGITSTPIIDAKARKIYVGAAIGTSTAITRHEVHALSVEDGADATTGGWPVDVTNAKSGSISFGAAMTAQNQRGALSLVNGILYIPYGGHVGDCGNYHGWVVAVDTGQSPPALGGWATGGVGEGIWQPGGMASDGTGVFAPTGNDLPFGTMPTTHIDSEEVVRVTGMGVVDKSTPNNYFYPMRWATMDSGDYDVSSVNPVYITEPSTYVVQATKDGHLYILNSKNLGGAGGQLVDFTVASVGMSIHTVPAAYKTPAGMHITLATDSGAICPMGMPSGEVVMSVLIPAGSPPAPMIVWCAAIKAAVGTNGTTMNGGPTAPIATTTDGTSESIVWYLSGGKLTGVNGDTGVVIYTSTDSCSGVHQWTSPIAVKGRIIVGGDNHLCSWTVR